MDIYRVMNGLVDNATNAALNTPDLKAMQEVAELVRSRADMPKEVIKLINTKLMKRDRKVTLLCLDLLEYLTYSCEITLYNQISSKDFLLKVGTILKSHDLGEEVIARTCQLIKCWRDLFNKDLHQFFFQFYENAIKRGIEIPTNYNSPYVNLKAATSSASSFSNGAFKATIPSSGSSSKVNQVPLSGPKAKLKADLDLVRENINLINEMIDGQDPKGNLEQNDSLCELLITLKSSETQMAGLIEKLAIENDEQMLELCLQLNDDMQNTFERQQSLKRHMKPKPFRSKGVEEDVMKKIEKLEITQKINQSSATIFAETAQALSQGLAKAQGKNQAPPPSFTSPPTFQPVQQPQQQVQKPVVVTPPPKPAATNLIDLLDDDEPPVKSQPQTQQNVIPQQTQSFVPPPVNNVPPQTQISTNILPPQQQQQQPISLTQLYQQNSNSQQAAQNKYQALNGFQTQPQGYPGVQNGPYGQQPMVQAYQGMGQPMYGVNPQGNLGYNTQPGYGMGYGTSPLPTVNTGYGTSSTFVSPQQTGGYGGSLPVSNIPQANKPGYGAPAKKDAFDDLDDMFGIGSNAPASKPVKPAQTNVSPTFDLF